MNSPFPFLAQTAPTTTTAGGATVAAPTTGATTTTAPGGPPTTTTAEPPSIFKGPTIPLLLGVAILYFFVFRSKRNQDKKRQDDLQKLKPGQRVQTIGGILGVITQVSDKEITVKVDETNNVKIKFARNAIHRVQGDEKTETKDKP